MQHAFEPVEPDGYHRNMQARRQHADARLKRQNFTGVRALAFRENQNAIAIRREVTAYRKASRVPASRCGNGKAWNTSAAR